MKLTTAVSLLFASLTAVPTGVAESVSHFSCTIEATYEGSTDPHNPLWPTSTQKIWLTQQVMATYNEVHGHLYGDVQANGTIVSATNDDFEMEQIILTSFDGPTGNRRTRRSLSKDPKEEENAQDQDDETTFLRGSNLKNGGWTIGGTGVTGCRLCKEFDDDDGFSTDIDTMISNLGTTTHRQWVAQWCSALQNSEFIVFQVATNCDIQLYDCVMLALDSDDEDNEEDKDKVEFVNVEEEEHKIEETAAAGLNDA